MLLSHPDREGCPRGARFGVERNASEQGSNWIPPPGLVLAEESSETAVVRGISLSTALHPPHLSSSARGALCALLRSCKRNTTEKGLS